MPDSPAFNPPAIQPKDSDPQIMKVDMKSTEWGMRSSQQPEMKQDLPIAHVKNGS